MPQRKAKILPPTLGSSLKEDVTQMCIKKCWGKTSDPTVTAWSQCIAKIGSKILQLLAHITCSFSLTSKTPVEFSTYVHLQGCRKLMFKASEPGLSLIVIFPHWMSYRSLHTPRTMFFGLWRQAGSQIPAFSNQGTWIPNSRPGKGSIFQLYINVCSFIMWILKKTQYLHFQKQGSLLSWGAWS